MIESYQESLLTELTFENHLDGLCKTFENHLDGFIIIIIIRLTCQFHLKWVVKHLKIISMVYVKHLRIISMVYVKQQEENFNGLSRQCKILPFYKCKSLLNAFFDSL